MLRRLSESLQAFWMGLPSRHRWMMALLLVGLVGAVAWIVRVSNRVEERTVVEPDAPCEVQTDALALLESEGIPHRIHQGAILVPLERADEALFKLQGILNAEMKLPADDFFSDRWTREKRWQIALQARLGAMISRLTGVRRATVQLTPPQESGFRDQRSQGSAAVLVEMRSGTSFSAVLGQQITEMVAAGTGIKREEIRVVGEGMTYVGRATGIANDEVSHVTAVSPPVSSVPSVGGAAAADLWMGNYGGNVLLALSAVGLGWLLVRVLRRMLRRSPEVVVELTPHDRGEREEGGTGSIPLREELSNAVLQNPQGAAAVVRQLR